jgi:hypothetical protein
MLPISIVKIILQHLPRQGGHRLHAIDWWDRRRAPVFGNVIEFNRWVDKELPGASGKAEAANYQPNFCYLSASCWRCTSECII